MTIDKEIADLERSRDSFATQVAILDLERASLESRRRVLTATLAAVDRHLERLKKLVAEVSE